MDDTNVKIAPAPWKCTANVYAVYFYSSPKSKNATDIPIVAYSPLEKESSFTSPEAGHFAGGVGSFMIVQYSDTPVGPYDELVIIPGAYTYRVQDKSGKWMEKKNPRATRTYVSQKHTCFNGRNNWNIPKHLARFEWKDLPNGAKQVKVFPFDTSTDQAEVSASSTPIFQASFNTIPYLPAFPMSTKWFENLGVNTALVQPPLPQGEPKEVAGTEQWCECPMSQYSSKTHIGWFDLRQRDDAGALTGLFENFWPGMKRWQLGLRMDDADLEIPEGEYWRAPEANP
ncbi:hypothetical protein VMCG_09014 [Cytospora schulzeri]|uniref:Uncharacterized protein n=1 Tax=Cytospora schulzeri TaxID=448051 RepID=A0A423VPL3_9PEZI|nr:hypothetical protein VMCG_09014 [Valsa malicola]